MSDRRLTPDPAQAHQNQPAMITTCIADLCRSPKGPRDRQLLYGAEVIHLGTGPQGWHYVQAVQDNYVGYVKPGCLSKRHSATHYVAAPATHAYQHADLKSPNRIALSHLSRVKVTGRTGDFFDTPLGFIPFQHLSPRECLHNDPAHIAALYLGTDYLWGGNSQWGIDCSGLIQAALLACGMPCPGDSDMQMDLGSPATAPYARNDLLFWKGHVALICDPDTLIHANAGSMAVNYEPINDAIARIAANGDGPVTAHRRLSHLLAKNIQD